MPEDIRKVAEEVEATWSNNGASISTRDTLVDGIARAILAERERCARIAEDDKAPYYGKHHSSARETALAIAKAIRSQP